MQYAKIKLFIQQWYFSPIGSETLETIDMRYNFMVVTCTRDSAAHNVYPNSKERDRKREIEKKRQSKRKRERLRGKERERLREKERERLRDKER